MLEGGLGEGGQGVAVEGEQGEGGDALEGGGGQRAQQVEPQVQHLDKGE